MVHDAYDIAKPPAPHDWLGLPEDERLSRVEAFHRRAQSPVGQSPEAHASMHVVVENRLAEGHEAVVAAYERCRAAGLDRHTTIHALASVVAQHMLSILEQRPGFDQTTADREFEAIDPATWKPKKR